MIVNDVAALRAQTKPKISSKQRQFNVSRNEEIRK